MSNGKTLPPLPASDEKAMAQNYFDGFYKVRARDFWQHSEVVRETPKEFEECEHYFVQTPQGAECKKCKFGLFGFFEIQDGKLLYEGETIGF